MSTPTRDTLKGWAKAYLGCSRERIEVRLYRTGRDGWTTYNVTDGERRVGELHVRPANGGCFDVLADRNPN